MLAPIAPFLTAELDYHHHGPFGSPSRPVRAAGPATAHLRTGGRLLPRLVRRLRLATQPESGENSQ
jgi:hypothetical protein